MKRQAFTLIELLVVIAILGLLAAILFPVFAHVRENGRRTVCLSNERQIGMALAQYVTDANEIFPQGWAEHSGVGWAGKCYPYVKEQAVFTCPDDPTEAGDPIVVCSFGFNSNLSGYYLARPILGMSPSKPSTNLSVLSSPSATVLLFEVEDGSIPLPLTVLENNSPSGNGFDEGEFMAGVGIHGKYGGPIYATGLLGGRTVSNDGLVHSSIPRHRGGANYLACDGHTVWLRPESVSGGSNAVAADCSQGTNGFQPADCRGQTSPHASGTESGKQVLTFSSV